MKKAVKLTLAIAMMMGATSLFAQKFGRIDMQALIYSMPETKDMQLKMEEFTKNLSDTYQTMEVEFNTKYQEFIKNQATMTDAVRQMKEKELNELASRRDEFIQMAQQDQQKEQTRLYTPIYQKAQNAVDQIAKAGGYTVIFQTGQQPYLDEAAVTDILAEVQTSLGIDPVAVAKALAEAANTAGNGAETSAVN